MPEIQELLYTAKKHVQDLYNHHTDSSLIYHNLRHTLAVVERVAEIGSNEMLSFHDQTVVTIAAWFHDTGHLFSTAAGHEQKSVEILDDFLRTGKNELFEFADEIKACILATKMPTQPVNIQQMVLCDADTYHLGTRDFFDFDQQVKEEVEARENIKVGNWEKSTLAFLKQHKYYTGYCQQILNGGKQQNIHLLEYKLSK